MQNKTHCTLLISCKESIMSAQHQKQQQKREKNKIRVKANLIITMFACVSIQHKSWTFLFATFKSIALCSQICVIISFISTNPILQVNAYTNWNWTQNMKKNESRQMYSMLLLLLSLIHWAANAYHCRHQKKTVIYPKMVSIMFLTILVYHIHHFGLVGMF